MADISSQINSLPQDLRDAIDNLQVGDLVKCLHCILQYSAVANEEALKFAVCRRDLLNLEAQYDSMHSEMSRQVFELRNALEAAKQRQFDMQQQLELGVSDKQSAELQVRKLQAEAADSAAKRSAYQSALLKANDELTKLQHAASELATENAQLKETMAQYQAQLAASALYCSSLEQAREREEPEMERSARVYRAGNLQIMPKTRQEDGIVRVQTCDVEVQVFAGSVSREAQTDPWKAAPAAKPEGKAEKLNLMRAPSLYSDGQKAHVISLLQEQNFDLRNLLVQQYSTNYEDKVKAFMLMDKLDAISFLLTQNENLAGALAAYQVLNAEFTSTVRFASEAAEEADNRDGSSLETTEKEALTLTAVHNGGAGGNYCISTAARYYGYFELRKQLEIALQRNAMLERRLGILKYLGSAPKGYIEALFYKTLAEVYEDVFLQGVRVHVAHMLAGAPAAQQECKDCGKDVLSESASLESSVLAALKKLDMRGGDASQKLASVLDLLLKVARNPANQPFLNQQLFKARREVAALQEHAKRQDSVLQELQSFTRFLGNQIEQKITRLQGLADSFLGGQKAQKLQQIAAEQNEVIIQLQNTLAELKDAQDSYARDLIERSCQTDGDGSEAVILRYYQQLRDLYTELANYTKTSADLAARLQILIEKTRADSLSFRAAVKSIVDAGAEAQRSAAEMTMKASLQCSALKTAKEQIVYVENAVFAVQGRAQELKMKHERCQGILEQLNGVVRVQQAAQTECAVLVDREAQNYDILEYYSFYQQTDAFVQADFAQQHDAVCYNCEMARDVYDAIKTQNSQLSTQLQLARQQTKDFKAYYGDLESEANLARQKAASLAAQLKQQARMTTREKIEARQHRKRAMELAAANYALTGENKALSQKVDYLSGQAAANAKGREQMKLELQALSAAYQGAADQAKAVKDKLDRLQKQTAQLESETAHGRADAKEASAACAQYKQQLEKALLDVDKWRQKYLQQRKAAPKRELDTDKQSTLESILSTDDIYSIYEW